MNFLALDTSSNACSVALQIGASIDTAHVVKPREHTTILIPMIEDILRKAGVNLSDLDGVILGNGPGSFIGMRIGASVAQGLAFGAGLKVVPVSSMATVAEEAFTKHDVERVIVAQDAHMNEVYLAVYSRDQNGSPVTDEEVQLHKVTQSVGQSDGLSTVAAGAGWQRYPQLFAANEAISADKLDILYPHARYLLKLGIQAWEDGRAISAEQVVPEYVRMTVAEKPRSRSNTE